MTRGAMSLGRWGFVQSVIYLRHAQTPSPRARQEDDRPAVPVLCTTTLFEPCRQHHFLDISDITSVS